MCYPEPEICGYGFFGVLDAGFAGAAFAGLASFFYSS